MLIVLRFPSLFAQMMISVGDLGLSLLMHYPDTTQCFPSSSLSHMIIPLTGSCILDNPSIIHKPQLSVHFSAWCSPRCLL